MPTSNYGPQVQVFKIILIKSQLYKKIISTAFAGFKIGPVFIFIANNFSKHPLNKVKI